MCGRLDAQEAPRRPTAYGTQITPTPRFFFLVVPWVWIWSGSNWIPSVADAFESASASVSVGGGGRAGMVCVMGHQQAWAGGLTGWGAPGMPLNVRSAYVEGRSKGILSRTACIPAASSVGLLGLAG